MSISVQSIREKLFPGEKRHYDIQPTSWEKLGKHVGGAPGAGFEAPQDTGLGKSNGFRGRQNLSGYNFPSLPSSLGYSKSSKSMKSSRSKKSGNSAKSGSSSNSSQSRSRRDDDTVTRSSSKRSHKSKTNSSSRISSRPPWRNSSTVSKPGNFPPPSLPMSDSSYSDYSSKFQEPVIQGSAISSDFENAYQPPVHGNALGVPPAPMGGKLFAPQFGQGQQGLGDYVLQQPSNGLPLHQVDYGLPMHEGPVYLPVKNTKTGLYDADLGGDVPMYTTEQTIILKPGVTEGSSRRKRFLCF